MSDPPTKYPALHYRWDVDKTYIHTDFDSVGDLLRAWRQKPEDKRNIPGAPALLRELLAPASVDKKVTFISGSPQQMREVLLRKFELDGIEPDAFILKPNLSNILRLRLRAVRNQVGYKLEALLNSRLPRHSEFLFGDDSEQDALIYSLYADMVSGAVGVDELQEILTRCGLYAAEVERVVQGYIDTTPGEGHIERVFIHLDRRSPVSRFVGYGPRVVPVYNYFQAALVLFDMKMLPAGALRRIVEDMQREGYTAPRLANSLQDLVRRAYVDQEAIDALRCALLEESVSVADSPFAAAFQQALDGLDDQHSRPVQTQKRLNYLDLIEVHRYRRPQWERNARRWLNEEG